MWKQLSAAGMVLLGHLHTHEFAAGGTTDQVGNPWDLERSPGGSSGGSGGRPRGTHGSRCHRHRHRRLASDPIRLLWHVGDQAHARSRLAGRGRAAVVEPRPRRSDGADARRLPGCCSGRWPGPIGARRRPHSMPHRPTGCRSARRRGRWPAFDSPSLRASASVELDADVAAGFERRARRLSESRRLARRAAGARRAGSDVGDDFLDVLTTETPRLPPTFRRGSATATGLRSASGSRRESGARCPARPTSRLRRGDAS